MRRLQASVIGWVIGALLLGIAAGSQAQDSQATSPVFTLRTSVKGGGLLFAPRGPESASVSNAGQELLGRVRLDSRLQIDAHLDVTAAYEQRVHRLSTARSSAVLAMLPTEATPAYRVAPLDWRLASSGTSAWYHEIDRAAAHVRAGRADVTVGRQAIGWGRGVVFGAVDLFAPFSPLEIDREWRRGIDAAHAEVRLSEHTSADAVVAAGRRWDESLTAGRVRGYRGNIDIEGVGGRRARDWFGGATTSAAIGGAEVHGEVAVFRLPGPLPFDNTRTVTKAVVGSSYRLPVGSGVLVYAEYHYSGFGLRHASDVAAALTQPAYAARLLRGDMQVLSRHATAVLASYDVSPLVALAASWVGNPLDGSGVVTPNVTVTPGDRVSVVTAAYLPYGTVLRDGRLGSMFGASPVSVFLQLRVYF